MKLSLVTSTALGILLSLPLPALAGDRKVAERKILKLKEARVEDCTFFVSPYGRKIVTFIQAGSNRIDFFVDRELTFSFKEVFLSSFTFSPNGKRYAFLTDCSELGHYPYQILVDDEAYPAFTYLDESAKILFSRNSKRWTASMGRWNMCGGLVDGESLGEDFRSTDGGAFSPDSKQVAFFAQEEVNRWFIILNGVVLRKNYYWEVATETLCFGPLSKTFAFAGKRDKRWIVNLDGNEVERRYHGILNEPIAFSPDGKHNAYGAHIRPDWFVVLDGKIQKKYDKVTAPLFNDGKKVIYFACRKGKWFCVVGKREQKRFDRVFADSLLFSPSGEEIAYKVQAKGKGYCVVSDGKPGPFYDKVGSLRFQNNGGALAYAAEKEGQWFVVRDGSAGEHYDNILPQSLTFSPNGTHMAFTARKGKDRFVVVDGIPSKKRYGRIILGKTGGVFFQKEDEISYYAVDGDTILRVTETLD